MHILTSAGPLVSPIAGVLILVVARLLDCIVAIYMIVIGLLRGGSPLIRNHPSRGGRPCGHGSISTAFSSRRCLGLR